MFDPNEIKKSIFRKPQPDIDVFAYAKLSPQARDLETAVLGAILLEANAIHTINPLLTPQSFYVQAHQLIYRAIQALHTGFKKIDALTVVEQLKKQGDLDNAGGPYYIAQLSSSIGSAAHIEEHALIIKEKALARDTIAICQQVQSQMFDDTADVFETFAALQAQLVKISTQITAGKIKNFADQVTDAWANAKRAATDPTFSLGLTTGFIVLDKLLRGLKPGNLVIVGGRPAMGKTAAIMQWIRHQIKQGIPVALFSLEMSTIELIFRMLSSEASIDANRIQSLKLSHPEIQRIDDHVIQLAGYPLYIIDDVTTLSDITTITARLKMQYNIGAMYLDYIQLANARGLTPKGANREQEISIISRTLKGLAKQLAIPVIALSQLSREVEKRPLMRPILTDLRESGAIEQDADVVLFLWRPDYYDIETDKDGNIYPDNYTEVIIAKQRGGIANKFTQHRFILPLQKFIDINTDLTTVMVSVVEPLSPFGGGGTAPVTGEDEEHPPEEDLPF